VQNQTGKGGPITYEQFYNVRKQRLFRKKNFTGFFFEGKKGITKSSVKELNPVKQKDLLRKVYSFKGIGGKLI